MTFHSSGFSKCGSRFWVITRKTCDCILMETLKRCLNITVINLSNFCLCIINELLVVTKTCKQSHFARADSIFLDLNMTVNEDKQKSFAYKSFSAELE